MKKIKTKKIGKLDFTFYGINTLNGCLVTACVFSDGALINSNTLKYSCSMDDVFVSEDSKPEDEN